MFRVCFRIWVCCRVSDLHRLITSQHSTHPTMFRFWVSRGPFFSGTVFPGTIFLGDHFSGDHFSRGPFSGDHFSGIRRVRYRRPLIFLIQQTVLSLRSFMSFIFLCVFFKKFFCLCWSSFKFEYEFSGAQSNHSIQEYCGRLTRAYPASSSRSSMTSLPQARETIGFWKLTTLPTP